MSYIISKSDEIENYLIIQLRNLLRNSSGSKASVARHVKCTVPALLTFVNGVETALNQEQKDKLESMIREFYSGKRRRTGHYMCKDGSMKWTSKLLKDGEE